jgi:hypothetical protein
MKHIFKFNSQLTYVKVLFKLKVLFKKSISRNHIKGTKFYAIIHYKNLNESLKSAIFLGTKIQFSICLPLMLRQFGFTSIYCWPALKYFC